MAKFEKLVLIGSCTNTLIPCGDKILGLDMLYFDFVVNLYVYTADFSIALSPNPV